MGAPRKVTLDVINNKLDNLIEVFSKHSEEDRIRFENIFFDGTKPSVFSRLNSLEETSENRKRNINMIWTAILGLAGTLVMKIFGGFSGSN